MEGTWIGGVRVNGQWTWMDGSDFDPAFISNIFTNNHDGYDYLIRDADDGWYNVPNSDIEAFTFDYVCQF